MAYQTLDLGTSADDGTGDSLRVGGDKINDNFSELYTLLGNGSILTTGLSVSGATITLSEAVGTFTTLTPPSADGAALGSAALEWSDIYLYDSSVIYFGINSDITLTHVPDVGLRLKSVATADDKPIILTLQTGETDIAASDVLGKIEFQAPDEGTGTDAILVAAHIAAISEGDFSASNNATKLSFATGASEAASEKMSLSSAGLLTIADDLVIKTGGTIGGANDTDLLTLTSAVLTVAGEVVGTGFTGTLDGILGSGAAAAATTTTLACTTVTASGDITTTAAGNTALASVSTGNSYSTLTLQNSEQNYSAQIRTDQSQAFVIRDETAGANRFLLSTGGVSTFAGEVIGTGFTGTLDGVLGGGTPAAASVTTLTTTGNIAIPNDGTIGSAGDADSIAIASNGVVTFSQIPVMPANSIDSDEYIDGSIDTAHIADNQITLAKMAGGTDGNIISYDASGDPVAIATGSDGQVLTSTGAGSPPAFEAIPSQFPSGTDMVFHQTAAPTGWTKNTTAALNDGALRTTTGTVGTGGTVAFETAFASQAVGGTNGNTGATTLSTAQLPSHTHTAGAPNQTAGLQGGAQANVGAADGTSVTGSTGGGGSHVHGGSTFSGTAIDLNVKFYDVIIAAKD